MNRENQLRVKYSRFSIAWVRRAMSSPFLTADHAAEACKLAKEPWKWGFT